MGSIDSQGVATVEVKPGRFVREVEARGSLKAVKATPILVPPESGRQQKVAFLAKDGAFVKAGETVVEFDPYDAEREAADGQSDLDAARAKIDKASAEGGKNQAALGLDRDVAKEQLDRAETFTLTDDELFSRHQIIESQLDKDAVPGPKADVAQRKLATSGKLSSTERALGEIDASKAQLKVTIAEKGLRSLQDPGPARRALDARDATGAARCRRWATRVWPGQKVAEMPDLARLEARVFVLEADAAGLKVGQKARFVIEGRPGAGVRGEREPRRAARQDARLAVAGQVLRDGALAGARRGRRPEARPEGARRILRLDEADAVLTIPRGALFDKDGKRVVYRKNGGGLRAGRGEVEPPAASRTSSWRRGSRPGDAHRAARPDREARAHDRGGGARAAGPGT